MAVVLVGGGARSGKSRFAQNWVEQRHQSAVYLATGEARDEEMRERIARHQADRGPIWTTVEEPLDLIAALAQVQRREAVLVDCMTLWLSNVLLHPERDAAEELDGLVAFLKGWTGTDLVLVTNEVGCGIVPENALAREFRDLAGRMNQRIAEASDEVYWTVFGQPLRLKPSGVLR
ncbi:MAG: bifunctional adenosylcobinamide kinase/adenosylcobinamide-phosphate guanylyltransferase [Bryobacterales bacterium]